MTEIRVWLLRGINYPCFAVKEDPEDEGYAVVSTNGDTSWCEELPTDAIELAPVRS